MLSTPLRHAESKTSTFSFRSLFPICSSIFHISVLFDFRLHLEGSWDTPTLIQLQTILNRDFCIWQTMLLSSGVHTFVLSFLDAILRSRKSARLCKSREDYVQHQKCSNLRATYSNAIYDNSMNSALRERRQPACTLRKGGIFWKFRSLVWNFSLIKGCGGALCEEDWVRWEVVLLTAKIKWQEKIREKAKKWRRSKWDVAWHLWKINQRLWELDTL